MKRSFSFKASLMVGAATVLSATPAFAQDYYSGDDGAFAALGCGIWACIMIPSLLLGVLTIWMLIDAIMRQEYEFPNSSGNSKLIWILLLVFVGFIAAVAYYFMVFKKIKRGSMQPPSGGGYGGGYQAPAPPAPPVAPPAPPTAPPPPPPPAPPQV